MAFCRYCGSKVNEGALFCAACGRQLRKAEDNGAPENDVHEEKQGIVPPPIPIEVINIENMEKDTRKDSMIQVSSDVFLSGETKENYCEEKSMDHLAHPDRMMQQRGQISQGYQMQQSGQIPQGYPMQQSGQIPQGYPMKQSGQIPQGYPIQQSGQIPQGYPMQQSGQIPQGYPMQQSGQIPQGYPMQQSGQMPQSYPMHYGYPNLMVQNPMYNQGYVFQSSQNGNNASSLVGRVDGGMGQVLYVFDDCFIVETTEEFELYREETQRVYQSKGASENEKGVLEEFADVGRELKNAYGEAFAAFGEAFSSSYAEKRKKKLGVLTIPVGEKKEYYSSCLSVVGINIGKEKKGYISIKPKVGEDIHFFFDGVDEHTDNEVEKLFTDMIKPRILAHSNTQQVKQNTSFVPRDIPGPSTSQSISGEYNPNKYVLDKAEEIRRIKELYDSGAISKKEFTKLKAEIVKRK